MPNAVCETELKFEIEPEAARTLRAHPALQAASETAQLTSTYFDTPEHDLRRSGLTLRIRDTGSGFVQTIKRRRRASGMGRDEWEMAAAAAAPDSKTLEGTPVAEVLNGDAIHLEPLFQTAVQRTTGLWKHGESIVEVSLDEGEISGEGEREPIRELELELKSGEPDALFSLARELSGSAALRLSFESKGERGYRLVGHDGLLAEKAATSGVQPSQAAEDAFRAIARGCLAHVSTNARLFCRARAPEALHQTRVGLRRFRSALNAFKSMLAGEGLDRAKAESKWLAGALDEARDLDVFRQTTYEPAAAAAEEDPAMQALGERLLRAQADAYDAAVQAVLSERFSVFLLETAEWVEVGDWRHADHRKARRKEPVEDLARRVLGKLRKKVLGSGADLAHEDAAERHQLRIEAKKLRYAAEMLGDAFGKMSKKRRKLVSAVRGLQDCLGEMNDIAVARELGLKLAGPRSPALAFASGEAIGLRIKAQPKLLEAAEDAFKALRKARAFWR